MYIRLNKVIKECNVGLHTAVEFLHKEGFAEVKEDLNYKITDEQYERSLILTLCSGEREYINDIYR